MENHLIEVIWLVDDHNPDGYGHEVWLDFLKWHICLACGDDGGDGYQLMKDELKIFERDSGKDVTAEFFIFKDADTPIQPTGSNLFQVMDVLKTNYKKEKERIHG